jgi:hypothetical protein
MLDGEIKEYKFKADNLKNENKMFLKDGFSFFIAGVVTMGIFALLRRFRVSFPQ